MRIKEDIKLNFDDVLMEPKRSTLSSRRDVDITRQFKFRNSGKELTYVPIMASNMDGVGTFAMAKVLQDHKMITVLRKHYSLEDRKSIFLRCLKNASPFRINFILELHPPWRGDLDLIKATYLNNFQCLNKFWFDFVKDRFRTALISGICGGCATNKVSSKSILCYSITD